MLNQCSVQDVNRGWGGQRKGKTGRKSVLALYRERFGGNSGKTLKQLQAEMQGSGEPFLKATPNVLALILCVCVCVCAQLYPTFCDPMNSCPPGSSVHGIFQVSYWSQLPFPIPGDLPNPGIKPESLASPTLAGRLLTTTSPGKPHKYFLRNKK